MVELFSKVELIRIIYSSSINKNISAAASVCQGAAHMSPQRKHWEREYYKRQPLAHIAKGHRTIIIHLWLSRARCRLIDRYLKSYKCIWRMIDLQRHLTAPNIALIKIIGHGGWCACVGVGRARELLFRSCQLARDQISSTNKHTDELCIIAFGRCSHKRVASCRDCCRNRCWMHLIKQCATHMHTPIGRRRTRTLNITTALIYS